jgi:tetratricopeptide (TPR) repeat protein
VGTLWLAAWSTGGGPGVHPGGLAERLPAIAGSALSYARLLVLPLGLHLERFTPVPGWSPLAAAGAWALVLALAAALVAAARRVPGGFFLLALGALAYAPVSNFVPVYPAIAGRALFTAEHFLYLPLVGLVPLGVGAVAALWPVSAARARPVVLAAALALWGAIVVQRNRDWRDEETLFRHTLRWNPPAARVWFNLGNLELAADRLAEAERLYGEALVRAPRDAAARLNLGIALQRQGRRAEAEAQYRAAIASDPRLLEPYRALAALLAARGATDEAARLLERAGRAAR